jgi:hypothetical protein
VKLVRHQYEAVEQVDALALVTEWKPFRHPDFRAMKEMMRQKIVWKPLQLTKKQFHLSVSIHNLQKYYAVSKKCFYWKLFGQINYSK